MKIFWSSLLVLALVAQVAAQVYPGDRSKFIRDVTYPDGSKVKSGQKLTKIWEVQNAGSVEWKDRYLSRQGDAKDDFNAAKRWTSIPNTKPGERCQLKIELTAPKKPGSCKTYFKMVELAEVQKKDGKIVSAKETVLFPNQLGVYIDAIVE